MTARLVALGWARRLRAWADAHRAALALGALSIAIAPVAAVYVTSWFLDLPPELRQTHTGAVRVLDRDGRLLREVRDKDGARSSWVSRSDAQAVVGALLATEDRRFASHRGIDYRAALRAIASSVASGRRVSGASTLTMQLARTVRPHPRTLRGKFFEAALALRIERALSKDEIVEQYINRVDFGPNLRGIGAASRAYFDKSPAALSLGEASVLAGAVRGPSYYDLAKHPDRASQRRALVLARMRSYGLIDEAQALRASREPIVLQAQRPVFGAPHFSAALLAGRLGATGDVSGGVVTTTLDSELQRAAELATERVVATLGSKHVTAASVVALDNASGEILAYVGSPDFFDEARGGQNDGVLALRQPGSTLKPFVYELAMERLAMTPATVLPDIELHLQTPGGDFSPRDYDQGFRGPVRLREALGNSLNIPAVYAAEKVGLDPLLARLRELGFELPQAAGFYGAALALGDGEVTLLALANAYATLARGGLRKDPRGVRSFEVGGRVTTLAQPPESRVMDALASARITDVLADKRARWAAFGEGSVLEQPFEAAGKTGTSKGYRDNWAVGFSRAVTVAAWAGNFDGSPMDDVSGVTGAGPLLHEVLAAAMRARESQPLAAEGAPASTLERVAICPLSGMRVGAACRDHVFERFTRDEAAELPFCDLHEEVAIDAATGRRAGSGGHCERVVRKTFERFAPEYASWAAGANRPTAPTGFSPDCPDEAAAAPIGPLSIRAPLAGARFVIDPDRPRDVQQLPVSVVAPAGAREVTLLVDGAPVSRAQPPFDLRWRLQVGDHVLTARSGEQSSPPVTVHVRE